MESIAATMGTVLIADDDANLSGMWRELLSSAGFNVVTAATGLKALDWLRNGSRVDVMLLDYKMPILDGVQTLGHVRNQFPSVKTIGVTGIELSRLPAAFREGVQKLLIKPVNASELIDTVSSVIGEPVAAHTEPVKRSMSWVRFSLYYALFLVSSLGILLILRLAASLMLSSP